jgi:hypothetical protein
VGVVPLPPREMFPGDCRLFVIPDLIRDLASSLVRRKDKGIPGQARDDGFVVGFRSNLGGPGLRRGDGWGSLESEEEEEEVAPLPALSHKGRG